MTTFKKYLFHTQVTVPDGERALVNINNENRAPLRKESLLTRDSRMVERKKPGRRKARRKFQFSKR